jgi:hypothetical protein
MTEPSINSGVNFNNRGNRDGSWQLVCLRCLMPVAVAKDETDLSQVWHGHVCLITPSYSWLDLLMGKSMPNENL